MIKAYRAGHQDDSNISNEKSLDGGSHGEKGGETLVTEELPPRPTFIFDKSSLLPKPRRADQSNVRESHRSPSWSPRGDPPSQTPDKGKSADASVPAKASSSPGNIQETVASPQPAVVFDRSFLKPKGRTPSSDY